MEQIETFIKKEQSRLLTKIQQITNTHLPITSFSISHFQRDRQNAQQPYLQHIALSNLLYSFRKASHQTKEILIQEFYCWRKQKCSEKDVTNETLFENSWLFFENTILTQIRELICQMPGTYITRLTEEDFIAIEHQDHRSIQAHLTKTDY